MAKYYGKVGYAETVESSPGVWVEKVTERSYRGDIVYNQRRYEETENLNDDLKVTNTISIVADAYANQNFFAMRYLEWMGARWKIRNVDVQRPRLVLTIGEVYNGPTP